MMRAAQNELNSIIEASTKQADAEVKQLHRYGVSSFLAAFVVWLLKTFTLVTIPVLFGIYTTADVLNPNVIMIISFIVFQVDQVWSLLCDNIDVPSPSTMVQEMLFVFYRAPVTDISTAIWFRVWAFVTRIWTASLVVFGATFAVWVVTQRNATGLDTVTGKNNVGQPIFDNALMDRGTTLFFVAAIEFIRSMITCSVYLNQKPDMRIWPRFDHKEFKSLSYYKAGAEAAIAMFTIPVFGGFVTYEYVLATAMVAGEAGDTGLFIGMMVVGSMLAMLLSWATYMMPFLRDFLSHARHDLVVLRQAPKS